MPITPQQRVDRRKAIGSSDSPAILGVDPWKSAHAVYLEKVFEVREIDPTEDIEIGNDFEIPLVRWAGRQLGIEVELNVHVRHPGHDIFAANLDGRPVERKHRFAIEAKSSGERGEYGEPGTDQVPDRVIVQAQHQMFCDNLDLVWVPVLRPEFGRNRRRMYKIIRNDRLIEIIESKGLEFWETHVLPRNPPSDVTPSLDVMKRIERIDETVDVDPALVEQFEFLKARCKRAEKARDEAQAKLIAALGNADAADFGDPRYMYTFRDQSRVTIDGARLKIAQPEIYEKFSSQTTFPVLRKVKRQRR